MHKLEKIQTELTNTALNAAHFNYCFQQLENLLFMKRYFFFLIPPMYKYPTFCIVLLSD